MALALACAPALAGCGAQPAAVTESSAAPLRPAALTRERLSDERTFTRHANAVARGAVRARPSSRSASIARLRYQTEDGPLETYLALDRYVDTAHRAWIRVRLPGKPNGRTGWVRREDLGPLVTVRTLLRIDRGALQATLMERGRAVWSAPIAIGAPGTPTPAGHFWIRTRLEALDGDAAYGPWAFGTSAYSPLSDWPGGGVVGIHGTDQPGLIPGRPSHGCIRVTNDKIRRLVKLMPIGTPVHVT